MFGIFVFTFFKESLLGEVVGATMFDEGTVPSTLVGLVPNSAFDAEELGDSTTLLWWSLRSGEVVCLRFRRYLLDELNNAGFSSSSFPFADGDNPVEIVTPVEPAGLQCFFFRVDPKQRRISGKNRHYV